MFDNDAKENLEVEQNFILQNRFVRIIMHKITTIILFTILTKYLLSYVQ